MEYIGLVAAELVGAALGALLNAKILTWRAMIIKHWALPYKTAYLVSIKAGLLAVLASIAAQFAVIFAGGSDELLKNVGVLVALVTWWLAHSNGLLKLAGPSITLTAKEARGISASVFGYYFSALLLGGLLLVVIGILIK